MGVDLKKRRTGRRKKTELLGPDEVRKLPVTSRLSKIEMTDLDARRRLVKMSRGEYMRACTFGTLPRTVPEINRQAWVQMARVSANLNQYQAAINSGQAAGYPPVLIGALIDAVEQLRRDLIGVSRPLPGGGDDESEEEDESLAE